MDELHVVHLKPSTVCGVRLLPRVVGRAPFTTFSGRPHDSGQGDGILRRIWESRTTTVRAMRRLERSSRRPRMTTRPAEARQAVSGRSRRSKWALRLTVNGLVPRREGRTVGASFLSTNAWEQDIHAEQFCRPAPVSSGLRTAPIPRSHSAWLPSVSAITGRAPWRVGGGFAISMMDLGLVQSVSDRLADASGLRSLLVTARASGSAFQVRSQGGVQFDAGAWRVGGSVRTPGLTFYRSGIVTLDGVISEPGATGASLFDTDAKLEYHLPWEFQGGVASPRLAGARRSRRRRALSCASGHGQAHAGRDLALRRASTTDSRRAPAATGQAGDSWLASSSAPTREGSNPRFWARLFGTPRRSFKLVVVHVVARSAEGRPVSWPTPRGSRFPTRSSGASARLPSIPA